MRHFIFSILAILFAFVSAPAFGAFITFGVNGAIFSTYQGPADVVASPILFYGVRPVSNAYAVANGKLANIVRASDSHTCDVLAQASGTIGITANCSTGGDNGQTAASFCPNTTTCSIATLYDQSGANACAGSPCDLTQATVANQPTLSFTCSISPCMTFGANVNVVLARASSPSQAQPFTYAAVWNQNGTCNAAASNLCTIFISDSAANYVSFWMSSNSLFMRIVANGGGQTANNIFTENVWHNTQAVFNGANSKLFFDGTSPGLTIGTPGTASMANSLKLGNDLNTSGNNGAFVGSMTEVGVWGSGFTATQQLALCTNQIVYYGLPETCTSPPTVTVNPGAVSYTGGGAAAVLNSGLAISSLQQNLTNATAQITGNLDATNDRLNYTTTAGVTGAYTASTGTMLLTGPATVAAFQAAMRVITYSSTITDPTNGGTKPTRIITWQVTE